MFEQDLHATNFLSLINTVYTSHPHYAIAIKVFRCVDYIEKNIDAVSSHFGKIFRTPSPDYMAVFLTIFKNAEQAKAQLTLLIGELKGCFSILLHAPSPSQNLLIHSFLNCINDSENGCMELRLRDALTFCSYYQSTGVLPLNALMKLCYQNASNKMTVEALLDHFSERIGMPVIMPEGDIKPLTWIDIKNYVANVLNHTSIEEEWKNYALALAPLVSENFKRKQPWHTYSFYKVQEAVRCLAYIKSILPAYFQSELAKASIKNKANLFFFELTASQHYTFKSFRRSDDIKLLKLFKESDIFVKSIRFDGYCFHKEFIKGITPSEKNPPSKGMLLRPAPHKRFTVTGTGVCERASKLPKSDDFYKRKRKRSALQSVSLITPKANCPVFGHNRIRCDELVGYMFLAEDAIISRLYTSDGGTIARPWEAHLWKKAQQYYKDKTNPAKKVLFASMEDFKQAIEQQSDKHNEVLARIRWHKEKTAIGIFSDSFSARCIAMFYAYNLKNRLKQLYIEKNKNWDNDYEIPIIYYIPNHPRHWTIYNKTEQLCDIKYANSLTIDINKPLEFLLLLSKKSLLKLPLLNGKTIFQLLLQKGQIQLFDALFELIYSNKDENLAWPPTYEDITRKIPFIKDNFQLATLEPNRENALHIVTALGRIDLVHLLVDLYPQQLNSLNIKSYSPLHIATERGHMEIVKFLLEKKADTNLVNIHSETPFMIAIRAGKASVVKLFMNDIANFSLGPTQDKSWTPLHLAAVFGYNEIVRLLLKADAEIDFYIPNRGTALYLAALYGHSETVKILLDFGANPNSNPPPSISNPKCHIPLLSAIRNGHCEVIKLLLAKKAKTSFLSDGPLVCLLDFASHYESDQPNPASVQDILTKVILDNSTQLINFILDDKLSLAEELLTNAALSLQDTNSRGMTALTAAIQKGYRMLANKLLKLGAKVNEKNSEGWAPIHIATQRDDLSLVKLLLENKATLLTTDRDLNTALHIAAFCGHTEVMNALLQYGDMALINFTRKDGKTALHLAAENGYVQIVELLLSQPTIRLNMNKKDGELTPTPLYLAAKLGSVKMLELLINHAKQSFLYSLVDYDLPLLVAIENGHVDAVKFLLQHKELQLNLAVGEDKVTFLYVACMKGHEEIVVALIQAGADIHVVNQTGDTPLHAAVSQGHHGIVRQLLRQGANVNLPNKQGMTPIYLASSKGYYQMVVELVNLYQAQPTIPAYDGTTALSIANDNGHENIVTFLRTVNEIFQVKLFSAGNKKVPSLFANSNPRKRFLDEDVSEVVNINEELEAGNKTSNEHISQMLWFASQYGNLLKVKEFLKEGAIIDIENRDKVTPLAIALRENHIEVVKVLLANGASLTIPDNKGETPLKILGSKEKAVWVEIVKTWLSYVINSKWASQRPTKQAKLSLFKQELLQDKRNAASDLYEVIDGTADKKILAKHHTALSSGELRTVYEQFTQFKWISNPANLIKLT